MNLRAVGIAASMIALAAAIPGNSGGAAAAAERDQALETLRQMIMPSPEAQRDYAVALAIWQRENAAPAAPERSTPGN